MRFEYFQLIDRIVELDLGKRTIRVHATVPVASTIFEGHFPGYPLMPGVLLLESMAQASGWLIIGATGFSRMPFLAAFNQAKLRAFVKPGETLEVTAALSHEGSGFARTKAEIHHEGKLACNAEITFSVVEFPNQEFRAHMEKAAAALAFPMEQIAGAHAPQGIDQGSDHG
jgi:3-hydroxyacyl-[acyl-carrier-protein] dehydratase